MVQPNFKACSNAYLRSKELQTLYNFTGQPIGIVKDPATQTTREGCNIYCGSGPEYYAWNLISQTITTWILPMCVLLSYV